MSNLFYHIEELVHSVCFCLQVEPLLCCTHDGWREMWRRSIPSQTRTRQSSWPNRIVSKPSLGLCCHVLVVYWRIDSTNECRIVPWTIHVLFADVCYVLGCVLFAFTLAVGLGFFRQSIVGFVVYCLRLLTQSLRLILIGLVLGSVSSWSIGLSSNLV